MKTLLVTSFLVTAFAGNAFAATQYGYAKPAGAKILPVQADCYALGEDKAAEMGGTLAKATPATDAGQPVCKVVIVVPGNNGERPKRVEVVIPQ
jgi:hypothetical protein